MEPKCISRHLTDYTPTGTRSTGRTKLRWKDQNMVQSKEMDRKFQTLIWTDYNIILLDLKLHLKLYDVSEAVSVSIIGLKNGKESYSAGSIRQIETEYFPTFFYGFNNIGLCKKFRKLII
jgi:hypothetical protein